MQPFQFNLQPAAPAYPTAGFAAFSQGMGNAARITADSGTRFNALGQVARDFMLHRNQREIQDREIQARKEYQDAWLSIQREQLKERMGYQASANAIAQGNLAAREAELAAARAREERLANDRAAAAAQARQDFMRQSAAAQLRMMGVQGSTSPGDILNQTTDPTKRGELEAQFRNLFRQSAGQTRSYPVSPGAGGLNLGAPQGQQAPAPAGGMLPFGGGGGQTPNLERILRDRARGGQARGGGGASAPAAPASQGTSATATTQPKAATPAKAAPSDAGQRIYDEVVAQTKAEGRTVEWARAELRRRFQEAGLPVK